MSAVQINPPAKRCQSSSDVMKKLPMSVQTFEKMIREDYLYIDKTEHILHLITQAGGYVFLSRPRRMRLGFVFQLPVAQAVG